MREILTCDGKWICVRENNFGTLMAYAEFLETHAKFGAFEKLEKGGCLDVPIADDHCLQCPYS